SLRAKSSRVKKVRALWSMLNHRGLTTKACRLSDNSVDVAKKKALRFPAGSLREELLLTYILETSGLAAGASGPQILKPRRMQTSKLPVPTGLSRPTKLSVNQTCISTGPKL